MIINRPPASLWSIAVTRNKNIINSGLNAALQCCGPTHPASKVKRPCILWNGLIGASLSEPHIDRDNVPRRGKCLYQEPIKS